MRRVLKKWAQLCLLSANVMLVEWISARQAQWSNKVWLRGCRIDCRGSRLAYLSRLKPKIRQISLHHIGMYI